MSKNFRLIQLTALGLYVFSIGGFLGSIAGAYIGGIHLWLTVMAVSGFLLVAVKVGDADIARNERIKK